MSADAAAVLLYHRIADLARDHFRLCLSPDIFREQMEYVARCCDPMPLSTLCAAATKGALPRRAVAITLDDGYLDALVASDVCSALKLPATFFINSNPGEETFHDTLARIVLESDPLPPELEIDLPVGEAVRLSTATPDDRVAAFKHLNEAAWTMSHSERSRLIEALEAWSGVDLTPRTSHRVLRRHELRELAHRPLHEIGAHTEHHLFMPAQPHARKVDEIAMNVRYLEDELNRPVTSFAYPYGGVDAETASVVRQVGLHSAVTVVPGPLKRSGEPLLVPRFEITCTGQTEFESLLESCST